MEFLKSPLPVAVISGGSSQLPATQAETVTHEMKLCSSAAPVAFADVTPDFTNGPGRDPIIMLAHCEKIPGMGAGTEDVTITLEAELPDMSMVAVGTYYAVADYISTMYYSFVLNDLLFGSDTITDPYLFDVNFIKKIKNIIVTSTSGTAHNVTLSFLSPRGWV
jgi:hypothetical protein